MRRAKLCISPARVGGKVKSNHHDPQKEKKAMDSEASLSPSPASCLVSLQSGGG